MATDPNLAPETHNSEQDDEDSQAQTVADQANALRKGDPTSSVKVGGGDTQDLVDHMRDMESSGRTITRTSTGTEPIPIRSCPRTATSAYSAGSSLVACAWAG